MIPILAKMAVERKCHFEHVILLGNYELSYSLGVLSKAFGLAKKESFDNVMELKKEIEEQIGDREASNVMVARLLRVVKEMDEIEDKYDDQMYELYSDGYDAPEMKESV